MAEWRRGLLGGVIRDVGVRGDLSLREALGKLASAIEARAKDNAAQGSHPRNTPTPAVKGAGPAIITGTLRRSIIHTRVERVGVQWQTRVGMAAGVTPPTGSTPSSKYGLYLETVWNYPFLLPAWQTCVRDVAPALWRSEFTVWPRIT